MKYFLILPFLFLLPARAELSNADMYIVHSAIEYCLAKEGLISMEEYAERLNKFAQGIDISIEQQINIFNLPNFRSKRASVIRQLGGCNKMAELYKTSP